MSYEYYEKREGLDGSIEVIGWKRVDSGVLAGNLVKCFIDAFDTEEEAEARYGEMNWFNAWTAPSSSLAHLPGPEDPVPGGMYPDDWEE